MNVLISAILSRACFCSIFMYVIRVPVKRRSSVWIINKGIAVPFFYSEPSFLALEHIEVSDQDVTYIIGVQRLLRLGFTNEIKIRITLRLYLAYFHRTRRTSIGQKKLNVALSLCRSNA